MDPFDFDFEYDEFIQDIVEKYENSVRENISLYLDSSSYELLADFYEFKGQYNTAERVINQALDNYPFSAMLLIKKAQILFDLKKYSDALECLEKAESIESSELEIYLLRSEILIYLSRHQEALDVLRERLEFSDDDDKSEIFLQMADIYEDQEDYKQVFSCLEECLKIDPLNGEALSRVSFCSVITEEYDYAANLLEDIINDDPYSDFAWYNLHIVYKSMDKTDKAIEALEYMLAINDNLDYGYPHLIRLYIENNQFEKALEEITEYESKFKPDENILVLKGRCYIHKEEYKLARYYLKRALHFHPNLADAYYNIGESYKLEENWQLAYKFFLKAAEFAEYNYDYIIEAVESALINNDITKAYHLAEKALDITQSRFEAYLYLVKILLTINDTDIALEVLETGIIRTKSAKELLYARVGLLYFIGKKKEAINKLLHIHTESSGKELFMFLICPEMSDDVQIQAILKEFYD